MMMVGRTRVSGVTTGSGRTGTTDLGLGMAIRLPRLLLPQRPWQSERSAYSAPLRAGGRDSCHTTPSALGTADRWLPHQRLERRAWRSAPTDAPAPASCSLTA